MLKSAPKPTQSGVAAVLSQECEVIYSNVFNTLHVGQISDLLAARLRERISSTALADELRFRALLLFGLFEAAGSKTPKKDQPLLLECGIDREKIAVGLTFERSENLRINPGISDRISKGTAEAPFEILLQVIYGNSHACTVRIEPSKVEIISVLGIEGKAEAEFIKNKKSLEVIEVDASAPEAKENRGPNETHYIEMGDLKYGELIREQSPSENLPAPPSGEIIASVSAELEEAIRIRSQKDAADKSITRVSGVTDKFKDDVIRIKGELGETRDRTVIKISNLEEESSELQESISKPRSGLTGLFKKMLKMERDDPEEQEEQEDQDGQREEDESGSVSSEPSIDVDLGKESQNLLVEIQTGSMDKTISRAKDEAEELQKEVSNARAKRWMDGLMKDLVAEKSRLHDMAKKLSTTIRQKEIDFRKREQMYIEELKRKEDLLRQKTGALTRTKEQVNHMTANMEKLKTLAQESTDEAHFKQKFEMTRKLLSAAKDENTELKAKMDEMKSQFAAAQLAQKRGTPSRTEYTQIVGQNERLQRQVEEFKKANQQLMDKMDKMKKERIAGGDRSVEEVKKRLDAAMKVITGHKRDAEQLQLKIDELQREEMRLKMELNRAQMQLKAAKGNKAA